MVEVEVDEVVAVAGHADEEVAVFVGAGLGVAQGFGVHDVELDVVPVQAEVGADEAAELVEVLLGLEDVREEALVEEGAAGLDLVHLGQGLDHGGGAVSVRAVGGRRAVGLGQVRGAAVGRGAEHLAEVDVAGGGEHVQVVGRALGVGAPVDGREEGVVDAAHDVVGAVVVVAEEGGLVPEFEAQGLGAVEVGAQGRQETVHGDGGGVEDVGLDGREAVGDGADAAALDVVGVVARSAVVVVESVLDAVVDDRGQEGRGRVGGVHALDVVVDADLEVHDPFELAGEGGVEVLEGREGERVAGSGADLAAGQLVAAVVQGQFQDLGDVKVARQDVGFLAEGARFDAARAAAFAGVLHGLADADLLHDHGVGVEDGRVAVAVLDDARRGLEEGVGGLLADVDAGLGLQEAQFVHDLEDEVGDVAHAVGTVAPQAAQVDVGEVVVGAAFLGRDADLGRGGMVVDLDPQAAEQFLGRLAGQGAVGQALLVEGGEVLVQVAGGHGVPAVQFRDGAQVHEPVHLQGFPEVSRGVGRDAAADLGDAQEFGLAGGVLFGLRLFPGQVGVALGEDDGRVAGDVHGPELFGAVRGQGIVQVVQAGLPIGDACLEIEHARGVDGAVQGRVTGCALLHEFGEEAGLVGGAPFVRHLGEDAVAHGAARPVGDDLALVDGDVLFGHVVAGHGPGVQHAQVLGRVAGQLGEGRHAFGPGPALADDELAVAEPEGLLLAEVLEDHGPQHGQGIFAVVLAVEGRFEKGALDGDGGLGLEAFPAQAGDSVVHLSSDADG